jgi:hypothetical protein
VRPVIKAGCLLLAANVLAPSADACPTLTPNVYGPSHELVYCTIDTASPVLGAQAREAFRRWENANYTNASGVRFTELLPGQTLPADAPHAVVRNGSNPDGAAGCADTMMRDHVVIRAVITIDLTQFSPPFCLPTVLYGVTARRQYLATKGGNEVTTESARSRTSG